MTYFNEFDPFAAAWLRQLMADGHLEPGTVDERSISDVEADDVRGHRRAHWFAGIAGWELALQLAGWPRERSVWTGSCPCQPYSSAGKRKGNADERDLWPTFARLIRECRPATVFGEQVSSAIKFGWIDRVRADLEAEGYAVGFVVLGAHSVQAPHQRQRLYWVAHANAGKQGVERGGDSGLRGGQARFARAGHRGGSTALGMGDADEGRRAEGDAVPRRAATRGVADAAMRGRQQQPGGGPARLLGCEAEAKEQVQQSCADSASVRGMADTDGGFAGHGGIQPGGQHGQQPEDGGVARGMVHDESERQQGGGERGNDAPQAGGFLPPGASGAVWDHWRDSITIECRDGKRRRVPAEPGVLGVADGLSAELGPERVPCPDRFPLAGKTPNRAGRLRGYGNAICVQTAALFVRAFLEAEAEGGGE